MDPQHASRLIRLARLAIASEFKDMKQQLEQAELDARKIKELNEHNGIFVTLLKVKSKELQGCVGFIYTALPLYKSVQEAAKSAAFHDLRFTPLVKDELSNIVIEISILTKPRLIKDKGKSMDKKLSKDVKQKIKIGRDGLIVEKGFNSGLLLPQVAVEYSWDVKTFLEQTCWKAGLSKGGWKDSETKIYTFEAEVFREKTPRGSLERTNGK